MNGVFEGLRVLDISTSIPAAFAARLLADGGAEVVKIEGASGDPLRHDLDGIYDFAYCNVGKRSVVLELNDSDGRAAFDELLDGADILIESLASHERQRLGLQPERMLSGRDSLVVVTVTPFGTTGPYRDWLASEHVVYAMGHQMAATGPRDATPGPLAPYLTWLTIGFSAAMVTAAAAYGARSSRGGGHYEISGMEAMAASIDRRVHSLTAYAYCGEPNQRASIADLFPPYANACADGWVSIATGGGWWHKFRKAVGIPELQGDEFASAPDVASVQEPVLQAWNQWSRSHTKRDITDLLQAAGVPAEPLNSLADLLDDPHFSSRDFFRDIDIFGEPGTIPGPIVNLVGCDQEGGTSVPELGEHPTEAIKESWRQSHSDGVVNHSSGDGAKGRPLEGVRVIDLGIVLAGPYGTAMLGDLGADVIRVENTQVFAPMTRGSMARPTKEFVAKQPPISGGYPERDPGERPWNRFPWFNLTARNKRSMTMDLRRTEGLEIFGRLVKTADVVVENSAPGVMERFGITWEWLREQNPEISLVRVSAFGQTGPFRDHKALGIQVEAFAGHDLLRTYEGRGPEQNTWAVASDHGGALASAYGAILAMHHQRRTGKGLLVDASLVEMFANLVGPLILRQSMNESIASVGNRSRKWVQGCYPCQGDDKWIVITLKDDENWSALCSLMGQEELVDDPRFTTLSKRRKNHDEVDALISAWTRQRSHREAAELLQALDIAAGPVLNDADAFVDEHLRERGFFVEMTQADAGTHDYPGPFWLENGQRPPPRRPPVRLGEHNRELYEELGITEEAYTRLEETGHIADAYADHIP